MESPGKVVQGVPPDETGKYFLQYSVWQRGALCRYRGVGPAAPARPRWPKRHVWNCRAAAAEACRKAKRHSKLIPTKFRQSVRTDRWRFTQWTSGEQELYDHENDPEVNYMLAKSHPDIVAALTAKLKSLPPYQFRTRYPNENSLLPDPVASPCRVPDDQCGNRSAAPSNLPPPLTRNIRCAGRRATLCRSHRQRCLVGHPTRRQRRAQRWPGGHVGPLAS